MGSIYQHRSINTDRIISLYSSDPESVFLICLFFFNKNCCTQRPCTERVRPIMDWIVDRMDCSLVKLMLTLKLARKTKHDRSVTDVQLKM